MNVTKAEQNAEYQLFLNSEKKTDNYDNAHQSMLQYLTNINFNEGVIQGYKNKEIKPIYEVTADRKTIFNLDTNTKQYLAFLQFMKNEFAKIYTDFENNDGDIITSHLFENNVYRKIIPITVNDSFSLMVTNRHNLIIYPCNPKYNQHHSLMWCITIPLVLSVAITPFTTHKQYINPQS
jgi:hypothetical protein